MKKYVNKSRFLKRIVVYVDKKAGSTKTFYLKHGQAIELKDDVKQVDEGIKVRDVAQPEKRTSKKNETEEGKE